MIRYIGIVVLWCAAMATHASQLPDFTQLVERHGGSVVNISTIQKESGKRELRLGGVPEGPFQDFFRHFFGEEGLEQGPPEEGEGSQEQHRSLGSGFIISEDGFILTNHHVIKDAQEIIVKLRDRRQLEAKLIGSDPESDLALLQVEAKGLQAVTLGSSETLRVGAWVLAIGSPFGFENTVTAGIVSAKGRSLSSERYVPFIQTDVAINPGNSGGPLFNLDGEVIGINAQILSRTGGYMGVSFAIPMDIAMDVVEQLKTSGKVARGFLGITFQAVTRELAESFGLDRPRGALVASVLPESPAAKAGFQEGDIVLSFDGKEINEASQLPPLVGRTKVGEKVKVGVFRHGRIKALSVTIAQLPESTQLGAKEPADNNKTIDNILKLEVRELTSEEQNKLAIDHGLLITRVGKGPAQKAGVRPGDVVLSLNQQVIHDSEDFESAVKAIEGKRIVSVLLARGKDAKRYLAIRLQ